MQNFWRNKEYTGDWESIRRMESEDRSIVGNPHRPWSEVYFMNSGNYKLTKEQSDAMYEEVYKPIVDMENDIANNNKELMKLIRSEVSGSLYYGICRYIKDLKESCCHVGQMEYKIVDKPAGKQQEESWSKELRTVWVDQHASGMDGDSFYGDIYIQLDENRFLTVNYSM